MLTSLDLDPFATGRSLDVTAGDLFELGLNVDVLVVSAYEGYYEGLPGSMIGQLRDRCGLEVGSLPREIDLTGTAMIRGWITPDLDTIATPPRWPDDSATRFRRLAVIESPREGYTDQTAWPAFGQLFCLLALLPLHGIHCPAVASPLLSAGNHGVDVENLIPALMSRCRDRLRHLPDLERLVIFDRNREGLSKLALHIDREARRSEICREQIQLIASDPDFSELKNRLKAIARREGAKVNMENIDQINTQLNAEVLNPFVLGVSARRLLENLVRLTLGRPTMSLHEGLSLLSARGESDHWVIGCMHQVRVFGNWMAHDQDTQDTAYAKRRALSKADVLIMLMALQRALSAYPWPKPRYRQVKSRFGTSEELKKPARFNPMGQLSTQSRF